MGGESSLSEARARIEFLVPFAFTIGMSDPNYGQLIGDAKVVLDHLDAVAAAVKGFAEEGMIDSDIADAVLFHLANQPTNPPTDGPT